MPNTPYDNHFFKRGQKFAWHDTIAVAKERVTTEGLSRLMGDHTDLVEFTEDCSLVLRKKVCLALNADTTFLADGNGDITNS